MKTLKNILDTYNWLSEAFVHQTDETTEQDTYSLENRIIYYKTINLMPISYWSKVSNIPDLIISNTYDEKTDTGMLLFKEPVTSIGNSAFYDCSSLKSVIIPNSVKSIGECAFAWCGSLEKVFYKGIEYKDVASLFNALENSKVSLGRYIFTGTKFLWE